MRAILKSLCLSSLAMCLLAACTTGPTREDLQRAEANKLRPKEVEHVAAMPETPATPVVIPVRVYATDRYRDEVGQHEERIRVQFAEVNEILAQVGARLSVVSIQPWHYPKDDGDLSEVLAALERKDPAEDGALVVGYVRSLSAFTNSHSILGRANLLGRHIIARGMNDAVERDYLKKTLNLLDQSELDEVYLERRRHKETVILLHEVGHCFGAMHTRDSDTFMHDFVDPRQATMTAANRRILLKMLDLYREQPIPLGEWNARARLVLETQLANDAVLAELIPRDVQHVLKWLVQEPERIEEGPELPPEHANAYIRARRALSAGRLDEAWRDASMLLSAYPDHKRIAELNCYIAEQFGSVEKGKTPCETAHRLGTTPLFAQILTELYIKNDNLAAARDEARKAEGRMNEAGATPQDWLNLAALYQHTHELTRAEKAASRASPLRDATRRLETIEGLRRMYGLPKGAVPAESEHEVIDLVVRSTESANPNVWDAAAKRVAELGDVAPAHYLKCGAHLRRRSLGPAARSCDKALAIAPDCVLAHTFSGHIDATRGDKAAALAHMRKARELAPELRYPWLALADLLRGYRMKRELADLDKQFSERFGERLP